MRLDGFGPITVALWNSADFEQLCSEPFDCLARGNIVLVAGDVQIIHPMCFCHRQQHLAGNGGVMMTAIRLIDFITDIAVVVGMEVVTDSQADFSNRVGRTVQNDIIIIKRDCLLITGIFSMIFKVRG